MRQPGVEVRPIEQIDGSAEFNEVFMTDPRCPKDNVVGGVNNGWKVAMTTLGFERGTSATTSYRRFHKEFQRDSGAGAGNRGPTDYPLIRQRLALAWSKIKIMEINGTGPGPRLRGLTPPAAWARATKCSGPSDQETLLLGMDILGMRGQICSGRRFQHTLLPGGGGRRPTTR